MNIKIKDGIWLIENTPAVLVESQAKLAQIENAQPGTAALTADGKLWMLDTDGTTWKEFNPDA